MAAATARFSPPMPRRNELAVDSLKNPGRRDMGSGECKIVFITGTDTGVGKTLLTALLLSQLRQEGCHALAMKPFCSGSEAGLGDVDVLYRVQDQELARHEINPFFFPEPLAPLVAARWHGVRVTLDDVLQRIHSVINNHLVPIENPNRHAKTKRSRQPNLRNHQSPVLLIEGAGGLLAPLGEGFNLLDLIEATTTRAVDEPRPKVSFEPQTIGGARNAKSDSPRQREAAVGIQNPKSDIRTIVVARNQLGTINHTLLTIQALHSRFQGSCSSYLTRPRSRTLSEVTFNPPKTAVVLMNPARPDLSSRSNPEILTELLVPFAVHLIPHLGNNPFEEQRFETSLKKLNKTLSRILS
jgi:dethiobiotin synthase